MAIAGAILAFLFVLIGGVIVGVLDYKTKVLEGGKSQPVQEKSTMEVQQITT